VIAYWSERFDLERFVPAAALLALAGAAAASGGVIEGCIDSILALALLAQFRLWDDLADRERDRPRHPERVLVAAATVTPFVAQTVALAAVNLLAVEFFHGPGAARLLLALNAAAGAYYFLRPAERTTAGDLVLLAKYPALVAVLAGTPAQPLRLTVAALVTYAAACAFEAWHDASGPLRVNNS
jgi:hypothetical protein